MTMFLLFTGMHRRTDNCTVNSNWEVKSIQAAQSAIHLEAGARVLLLPTQITSPKQVCKYFVQRKSAYTSHFHRLNTSKPWPRVFRNEKVATTDNLSNSITRQLFYQIYEQLFLANETIYITNYWTTEKLNSQWLTSKWCIDVIIGMAWFSLHTI